MSEKANAGHLFILKFSSRLFSLDKDTADAFVLALCVWTFVVAEIFLFLLPVTFPFAHKFEAFDSKFSVLFGDTLKSGCGEDNELNSETLQVDLFSIFFCLVKFEEVKVGSFSLHLAQYQISGI